MNSPTMLNNLLPQGLADGRKLVARAVAFALKTEEQITVSEWADRYRRLSSKSSEASGQWRTSFTPYLREIMDAQSIGHPGKESSLVKGTQIGGSEAAYNALGYWTDQSPGPGMVVMPTREMSDSVAEQRLDPMFQECERLRVKIGEHRSRDAGNNKRAKHYPGGVWYLRGANSAAGLGSNPIRYLLLDETDKYQASVGDEGDPVTLAKKRQTNFRRRKCLEVSSPKIKGSSRITRSFEASTQGRYNVPCPHCAHEQVLVWAHMRWTLTQRRELICTECGAIGDIPLQSRGQHRCGECQAQIELTEQNSPVIDTDEIGRVWYECESCGGEIEEHHKTRMLEAGRHIHAEPGPGRLLEESEIGTAADRWAIWVRAGNQVRRFLPTFERPLGWHVSALYSPLGWFSWRDAVRQFLNAQKGGYDAETGESYEQVFHNTVLGEAYALKGEQPDTSPLKLRAEPYRLGEVPKGGLMLTASADVQGNRIEVKVKAYGRYEESWLVDYQVLHGDPSILGPGSVWAELEKVREKGYPHAGGSTLKILALGVDSGGHHTQEVYLFCSKWAHRNVFAVKGANKPGRPVISNQPSSVDINYRGKVIKEGAMLWMIGTDTAKALIYRRLKIAPPMRDGLVDFEALRDGGLPGYMHFPQGLPDTYYDGLTAEKMITRTVKGFTRTEWIKERERNEPLDLEVYAYAAAIYAGVQRTNWDQLEQFLNPPQPDLFLVAAQKQGAVVVEAAVQTSAQPETPEPLPEPPLAMPKPRKTTWVTGYR